MPTNNKSEPAAPPKPRGGSPLPAVLVLIAGALAAFNFRRDDATPAAAQSPAQPQPTESLVRRAQPPANIWNRSSTQLLGYIEPAERVGTDAQPYGRTAGVVDQTAAWDDAATRSSATVTASGDAATFTPPPMTDFAAARTTVVQTQSLATMRPFEAVEAATAPSSLSSVPANAPRRHTVRDGDTLGGLAERYYGDARRYREIFDANRSTLTSPEMLPIGATLTIPAYDPRFVPPPAEPSAARLVPQVMIRQP
jgi:nucleoid-associated protein YgaU